MAYLTVEDSSQMNDQAADDMMQAMAEERRQQATAADILVHLQRMRNARIQLERNPQTYHATMGDYYRAMGRIVDLLDEFRIERWTVPEFVMEIWDAERKQELARRAA